MDDSFAIVMLLFFLVLNLFLCGFVGKFAENRGRSFWFGFLMSFFLSPLIGVVIVWLAASDFRSDPLVGARLSSEEYLRAEQLRLQLRRTELRWGMFSNLLYLSLFIGGAYYLYHHPGPLRPFRDRLLAGWDVPPTSSATPSPSASASPVSLRRFSTVAEAQQEAMRLYPPLGVPGSTFNRAFVARTKLYQQQRADYFRDINWPITLAQEISSEINSQ
jgi:hypothetical protein